MEEALALLKSILSRLEFLFTRLPGSFVPIRFALGLRLTAREIRGSFRELRLLPLDIRFVLVNRGFLDRKLTSLRQEFDLLAFKFRFQILQGLRLFGEGSHPQFDLAGAVLEFPVLGRVVPDVLRDAHRAELRAAHRAEVRCLGGFGRQRLVVVFPCGVGVER